MLLANPMVIVGRAEMAKGCWGGDVLITQYIITGSSGGWKKTAARRRSQKEDVDRQGEQMAEPQVKGRSVRGKQHCEQVGQVDSGPGHP